MTIDITTFSPDGRTDPDIIDARVGIVSRTWSEALPAFVPPGLRVHLAQLSRTDPFGSPLGSDTTAGCVWWDAAGARMAAIGEAVEWYSASLVPGDLVLSTSDDLAASDRIELAEVALYTEQQWSTPGFPFRRLDCDLPIRWAVGHAVADGRSILVPASLTYLGYTTGPTASEPLTNLPVNAGIAAHTDPACARDAALREVVERDALAEAWMFDEPLVPIELPDWFSIDLGGDDDTTWALYRLPTRISIAGILAVVRNAATGVVGVGSAVRSDPIAAARKAVAEASIAAASAIEIDGAQSRRCARLVDGGGPLAPWRADRRYVDDYRDDWRDVVDIACHAQLYLDPALQRQLDTRLNELSRGHPSVALESLPDLASNDLIATLLVDAGFDPVMIDVTTSDVASLGWCVLRAMVPGLRSTGPAAFPYLGETRRSRHHACAPHLGPVPHV